MRLAIKTWLVGIDLALIMGLGEAGTAAGDRIRISPATNVVTLPGSNSKQTDRDKFGGPVERKPTGEGPTGVPFVAPSTPAPLIVPNQRLEELIDRSQHWIFQTPEMMNEQPTAEEALNVREIRFDGQEGKPKKTVTRYLEGTDRPLQTTNRLKNDFSEPDDRANPGSRLFSPVGSELGGALGRAESTLSNVMDLNRLFNTQSPLSTRFPGNSLTPVEASLTPWLSPEANGRLDGVHQRQLEADERFQRLLRPADFGPAAGGLKDPINLFGDTSSKELQPITANRVSDYIKGNNKANLFGPLPSDTSLGHPLQAGVLEDLNRKVLGPSSLSPAVDLPARPPSFQPLPVILELPRRKF